MRNGTDYNILVEIPEGAHKCADNRVYIVLEKRYYEDLHYNMDRRAWLGKAVSDSQMHPNNNYKILYADKLKMVNHINLPAYTKRIGMYAAVLAVGEQTGLYEDLVNNLGPRSANLVMDYAAYSILTKSNAAKDFEVLMKDQMLFLDRPYSDSWIQDQFDNTITDNQVQAFKVSWMKRFRKEELSNAWICIDGTNDDCTANIEEAEKGKAKSHKNINIISFLYAVTETGIPIISQVYRGGRVDCQAVKEMISVMTAYGIKPKGIILDRGFCDESCISLLIENKYDFVIMMKENTNGFQELLAKYKDEIRLKWKYALGHGLFGAADRVKLFKNKDLTVDAAIIWDGKNGIDRISCLIDNVMDAIREAETAVASGETPTIKDKYRKYLQVIQGSVGAELVVREDMLQTEIESKGFSGLICSKSISAGEANEIYDLRDSSEKQYSIMKTQLGDSVFRVQNMHRIVIREMIAFVASVIRHRIMKGCHGLKPQADTNVAIKELNLITMNLVSSDRYQVIHNQCRRQKDIMSVLGITSDNLDNVAAYETNRINNRTVYPIQTLSLKEEPGSKNETVKIQGIPVGSSAQGKGGKKTPVQEPASDQSEKRKPGRPKGSKNKPKESAKEPGEKRRPGRPKGSRNKPKTMPEQPNEKRRRGRPKGSKNKPKP